MMQAAQNRKRDDFIPLCLFFVILRFADLNDDGNDELLYGAPTYDFVSEDSQREDTGILVVFWGSKRFSRLFDQQLVFPSSLPIGIQASYLVGADADDETVYGLAVYDFDGMAISTFRRTRCWETA